MLSGFKKFVLRGNVVDLAVGVVIGAAFGTLVNSLVKDVFTPAIAAIFKQPDFSTMSIAINGSPIMYGNFLNAVISFLIVSVVIYFFVVLPINKLMAKFKKEPEAAPSTKICPECASAIPLAAKRCPLCTSAID